MILSVAIAAMDAILKGLAIKYLPENGEVLSSPIDLALHKNPGIAFDIPIPLSPVVVFTLLVCIILIRYAWNAWPKEVRMSAFSVMIIAGALNNMIDRIMHGFTTDYIILFERSAINLADILILLGTLALLWYSRTKPFRKSKN